MAARPEHGRTVFRCERTERPDDIDLIFAAVARRLPEILIAVRDLRERAFVQFDGLGEVEDDPVAPGFEHRLDDPQHLVASDQCGRMLRTAQQGPEALRSAEHTSELQSLMRIPYAVFCLKKQKHHKE